MLWHERIVRQRCAVLAQSLQGEDITQDVPQDFDPVKEAFKVYYPHDTGFVDIETLKGIFTNLGFGDITPEDVTVLVETADSGALPALSVEATCHASRLLCTVAQSPGRLAERLTQCLAPDAATDGDGRISLSDFRRMVSHSKSKEADLDLLHATVTGAASGKKR